MAFLMLWQPEQMHDWTCLFFLYSPRVAFLVFTLSFFLFLPLHLVPFGRWIAGFILSHERAQQSNQSTRDTDRFGASRKHPELVLSSGRSSYVVVASIVILPLLSFVLRVADHSHY
ncbi:hypothetical protein F4678DRAFT_4470 [Xylaria arbuscula]|nr:hypothetical protein F4678DRAFT_4470 [Xylaria arbuscula]